MEAWVGGRERPFGGRCGTACLRVACESHFLAYWSLLTWLLGFPPVADYWAGYGIDPDAINQVDLQA